MPLVVLLKRFEVWLLLGVVFAVLFFAFAPEKAAEEEVVETGTETETKVDPEPVVLTQVLPEPKVDPPVEEKAPPALIVEEVHSESAEGGQIISLKLLARSLDGKEIVINDQALQVSTDTGASVPRFFAPFQGELVVATEEPTEVEVKYWLATGELDSAVNILWLDFQGEKTEAKIPGNG